MTTTTPQDYGTIFFTSKLTSRISPVDVYVGTLIRARRKELKISQTSLGRQIGVTFQQIQKYESGANRISLGRFFQLCRGLNVDADYFFDKLRDANFI